MIQVSKKSIKSLEPRFRPREKLIKLGVDNLTDLELLTIILGRGTKNNRVQQLAIQILKSFPLKEIKKQSISKLAKIPGIGKVQASQLIAALELGSRTLDSPLLPKINHPKAVFQLLQDLTSKTREHAVALYLNGKQELIQKQTLTIGSHNFNLLEAKDVFAPALTLPASFVILAHNHPSNTRQASPEDIEITKKLVEASKVLGVMFIDHIIITKNDFFSFREEGLIDA